MNIEIHYPFSKEKKNEKTEKKKEKKPCFRKSSLNSTFISVLGEMVIKVKIHSIETDCSKKSMTLLKKIKSCLIFCHLNKKKNENEKYELTVISAWLTSPSIKNFENIINNSESYITKNCIHIRTIWFKYSIQQPISYPMCHIKRNFQGERVWIPEINYPSAFVAITIR